MEKILLLLFILISLVPVFFINKWLKSLVLPRKSLARLVLYFLVVLEFVFAYTYVVVMIITKLFPLSKG
jgi:hypothetical protein